MKLFTGHLPYDDVVAITEDPAAVAGVDLLLTVHDDGTHEVAARAGRERRDITWSRPIALTPEPAEVGTTPTAGGAR